MNYLELLYSKYQKVLLTKKEVAGELGISESSLNRRLSEGEPIPHYKQGGIVMFTLKGFCDYCTHASHLATLRIGTWPADASTLGQATHRLCGQLRECDAQLS